MDPSKGEGGGGGGGHMARREPRVQSIKREKKSHLGEISPKIIFFGNVREREIEEERILW